MRFAMDRSNRSVDADGRMHIANCPISKATVNPYFGWEIPDCKELGLDPKATYMLLRDPGELEKAVDTFNNIQLLDTHDPLNADDPKQEIVAGTTGTDTYFDGEYLRTTLTVWTAAAIEEIEDDSKRQLSACYRHETVMEKGTYRGLRYDGRMVNIIGNHVALVEKGRAGPDVLVSDELPKGLSMNRAQRRALARKIKTRMAADADIGVDEIVDLIAAAGGSDPDNGLDDTAADDDLNADPNTMDGALPPAVMEFLKGKLSDEDMAALGELCTAGATEDADPDDDGDGDGDGGEGDDGDDDGKEPRRAQDRARRPRVAQDADSIRRAALRDFESVQRAREKVLPFIGRVTVAMDGADPAGRLYRLALDGAKVRHKHIRDVAALEAMVDLLPRPAGASPFAQDSDPGDADPLKDALAGARKISRS